MVLLSLIGLFQKRCEEVFGCFRVHTGTYLNSQLEQAKDGYRARTAQVMKIGEGMRIQVTIEDIYCYLGCLAAVVIEERHFFTQSLCSSLILHFIVVQVPNISKEDRSDSR